MRTIIARRGSKRKILEVELPIEFSRFVIERMGYDFRATDHLGNMQRRLEGVLHQIGGVALPLIVLIDRQLSEEQRRDRIGAIALLRLGKIRALDLRSAQGDVADNPSVRRIGDDGHSREIVGLVEPSVTPEPGVHRRAPAVEALAVIAFKQRARRSRDYPAHRSQDGLRRASFASFSFALGGPLIHASKASSLWPES